MLLRTEKLTKKFGGLTAVNNLDLTIESGQIVAIIGPNGAGKTTAFNLISGVHQPTTGKILFNDEDITQISPNQRAEKGIARTFQTTSLFEKFSVLDNVYIGYRLHTTTGLLDVITRNSRCKSDEKACLAKAWEVLEFTGIAHLAQQPAASISQEAKKRVAIALAMATAPKLILLDEPAAGINFDETQGIADLIKKLRQNGLTVCLIEHKMSMVMNLVDKIFVLNYGDKIASGSPCEIVNNKLVIEAYLGGAGHAQAQ